MFFLLFKVTGSPKFYSYSTTLSLRGSAPTSAKSKRWPVGLGTVPERAYKRPLYDELRGALRYKMKAGEDALLAAFRQPADGRAEAVRRAIPRDPYSDETIAYHGWPIAVDRETQSVWPVHCYAMVDRTSTRLNSSH